MENGGYNRISGRKTLVLVTVLIVIIIALSVFSIYLLFRKSVIVTNSSYYEKPTKPPASTSQPTPTTKLYQPFPERTGD